MLCDMIQQDEDTINLHNLIHYSHYITVQMSHLSDETSQCYHPIHEKQNLSNAATKGWH